MSITVTITERVLLEHDACKDGIALWRQIAEMSPRSPKGRLRVRVQWTRLHQLWAATAYPAFWAWLRDKGLAPQISLARANLYGANLYGANLTRANLYGADLYGANLTRANLYGANLYGANLYGANLYGANLTRANLYGANLTRANLDGADLGEWERGTDGFARKRAT